MDKEKMDNYRPEEGTQQFLCDALPLCIVTKDQKGVKWEKHMCAAIWLGIFVCLLGISTFERLHFQAGYELILPHFLAHFFVKSFL